MSFLSSCLDVIMNAIYTFLGWIMNWCYGICHNYGLAIVLFTFCSKIILLPVSLWTYFNSITMIKIQPDINMLKVKYYGQQDMIAEEQSKLFKEKKYNPMASIVPTVIQLVLLAGVVGVIKLGMKDPSIDMHFGPINLGLVPSKVGISLFWVPLVAGLSSFILCIAQNLSNVLQAEQSKANKYGTMALSVGLSLYLGCFVNVGTAFYWVCSNLMAVLQMYICNWIFKPRQYVDYEKLEESRRQLKELSSIGKKQKVSKEARKKERQDYKRFFSVVNKHIVFYSESNGFYKYFKNYIEYLNANTNLTIHYITSDPNDKIFEMEKTNPKIRGYYIGENKLITLMMKLEADVVVMTMPDLENYHIKRSYYKKDVEYIFVQHGMGSNNMGMRKGCVDHFDTIFCAGPHQREEVEQTEEVYGLPHKTLVDVGYPLLDDMRAEYYSKEHKPNERKKILIAPSWQKDNIVDSCLEQIIDSLAGKGYDIIVRPHPQEVRLKAEHMDALKSKYENFSDVEIQTDFSSNNPILEADLLITDWSGISWEYAFTKQSPILFIDTPMKIMNPEYQKISTVPLNILLRDKLGRNLKLDELDQVPETVDYLISHSAEYHEAIGELLKQYIYNPGNATEVGANYMIQTIQNKIRAKKEAEKNGK